MILSGKDIEKNLGKNIIINPFSPNRMNPNSYNLTLAPELATYARLPGAVRGTRDPLDMRTPNDIYTFEIPEDGFIMCPGKLYLGRTNEFTETHNFVPMLEGRSSIGRLGICVHVTAGFGDVGFKGYWTLELFCVEPVIIYPNVEICQIYYHNVSEDHDEYCSGKYQNNTGIQPSLLYRDFGKKGMNTHD